MAQPSPVASDISLTIRRTFPVPRERVFRAWTEASALQTWSCPVGMTVLEATVDLRVGGAYRIAMQDPSEAEPNVAYGTYREVRPPERLVYTWQWEGGEMSETQVTIEFHDLGGETEVVLLHELFPNTEFRDRHNSGWVSCLDNLARVLSDAA